jgi:hypothetical protein
MLPDTYRRGTGPQTLTACTAANGLGGLTKGSCNIDNVVARGRRILHVRGNLHADPAIHHPLHLSKLEIAGGKIPGPLRRKADAKIADTSEISENVSSQL